MVTIYNSVCKNTQSFAYHGVYRLIFFHYSDSSVDTHNYPLFATIQYFIRISSEHGGLFYDAYRTFIGEESDVVAVLSRLSS